MPRLDRPRTTIEALFEHPLIGSDNGEQGIGPTLGESVGGPGRAGSEARVFADRRRTLISTTARAPLGSEIARALSGRRRGEAELSAPAPDRTVPHRDADGDL